MYKVKTNNNNNLIFQYINNYYRQSFIRTINIKLKSNLLCHLPKGQTKSKKHFLITISLELLKFLKGTDDAFSGCLKVEYSYKHGNFLFFAIVFETVQENAYL